MRVNWWKNSDAMRRGNALLCLTLLVMPANAGIQYAAASRLKHSHLWNTGSPG
jgi:hypothetical protein